MALVGLCALAVRRDSKRSCFVDQRVSSLAATNDAQRTELLQHPLTADARSVYITSSYFPRVTDLHAGQQQHDAAHWQVQWPHKSHQYISSIPHRRIARSLRALIRLSKRKITYDAVTKVLAAASVLPALVLAGQPLLAESSSCSSVAVASEVALGDWQGPLRDMFSFTVLLSVFITCEPGAAASAAVCAAGGAIALCTGPVAPPMTATYAAALLAAAAAMIVTTAAYMGSRRVNNTLGKSWKAAVDWQANMNLQACDVLRVLQWALGILGGGLLLQFLCSLWAHAGIHPTQGWLTQVAIGAAAVILAGLVTAPYRRTNKQLQQLYDDWPAWSATLLLILQPLRQLVTSAVQPWETLPGISSSQQLLLVFASGLMVPRALFMGELMWFTGTGSGSLLAAGQLLVWAVNKVTNYNLGASLVALLAALALTLEMLRAGWATIAKTRQQAAVT